MTKRPTISVILPTYCPHPEVEEKLWKCLASIGDRTSTDPASNIEIIVVEQSKMVMAEKPGWIPQADAYLHLAKPCGFARAVNLGVSLSHGEFLFIVNNDIVLPPNWDTLFLAEYSRIYRAFNDRIALLAPIDYDISSVPNSTPAVYWDSWWSCVLIPRVWWDEIGPLDERLLPYRYHDQDWSIRANELGYHVLRSQVLHVTHDEASTYRHMKSTVREDKERNAMLDRYNVLTFMEWIKTHPVPSTAHTLPGKDPGQKG